MKNLENTFHVVYASDDRFAKIMGVSLVSLYENNKNADEIVVYILDSGISDENKANIESVCSLYHRTVPRWIQAKDISKELQIDVVVDRGSLSQYARLFVSSALSADLVRVLYLDCDIIINQSIEELWNLNMQGKTIAALKDAFSSWYRMNIDLEPNDIMFNSGVMLIDLKRWKEQKVEEQLLKFIAARKGKIQQGDQGALNAVLSRDTLCFEPRFNAVTIYFDFDYKEMMIYRKPSEFYSAKQIKIAIDEPVIIHFTTSFLSRRPWVEGCQHRYVGEWIKYKKMSPWKNMTLWQYKKPKGIQGMYIKLVNILPRKINIGLSGFLQAYGRPVVMKIKNR